MRDDAAGGAPTPPYSPELIADLHAGVLPVPVAEALWTRVHTEPDSVAVLAALDATVADLRALAAEVEPMPDLVAARLRGALASEPASLPGSTPTPGNISLQSIQPPQRTPATRPQTAPRFAILAAAAAVLVVMAAFFGFDQVSSGPPAPNTQASGPSTTAPAVAPAIEIPDGQVPRTAALAVRDTAVEGRLADDRLRSDCLRANGYASDTLVLGSAPAKVGGRIGTLLLIPGDRPPSVIALVVGDRCTADNPDRLAINTVSD